MPLFYSMIREQLYKQCPILQQLRVVRLQSNLIRKQTINSRTFVPSSASLKITPYISGQSTHFGFEEVNIKEKEARVRQVFDSVAESYDVMNDVMSGGLHRLWKDHMVYTSKVSVLSRAVRRLQQKQNNISYDGPKLRILDVAGGTGDIAFRLLDNAGCLERSKSSGEDCVSVTVCDINREMLRVGEGRARRRYGNEILDVTKALRFTLGDAQDLKNQFEDDSFDLYTIAFGLRNVTDIDSALAEAYRLLKPGGRFMCLEFSHVPNDSIRAIYDAYSFHIIPALGEYIAKDRSSYQYLVESIRKFSNQQELVARLEQVGFRYVKYSNMNGGIVALHEAWKPV